MVVTQPKAINSRSAHYGANISRRPRSVFQWLTRASYSSAFGLALSYC